MRVLRFAWPIALLFPLWLIAGKWCQWSLIDPVYHGILWLHERLPQLFVLAAILALTVAAARFIRLRAHLDALVLFGEPVPSDVLRAVQWEAELLHLSYREIVYLDVDHELCFTTVGGRILISRGFRDRLKADELHLVMRHELLHVQHHDAERSLAWHLLFSALLLPGFDGVEAALYEARERRVNMLAAQRDPQRYVSLMQRCALPERAYHLFDSSNRHDRSSKRTALRLTRYAPAGFAILLLLLLPISHIEFTNHLRYELQHHC